MFSKKLSSLFLIGKKLSSIFLFFSKMFDYSRFKQLKLKIFSTITFAVTILIIIFADSIITNVSLHFKTHHHNHFHIHQSARILKITSEFDGNLRLLPLQPENRPEELQMFETSSDSKTEVFDFRVKEFFTKNQCKVQVFMTWISKIDSFGERQFFGLESLFKTNPRSCLIILSNSMDSEKGSKILAPLKSKGFSIEAMAPDLWGLLKNTPAERWFLEIKNGSKNCGEMKIPIAQNLSNLIRLAVLYKYGGVYLDTDFIILKDFSGLRNSIGAQSVDPNGNWTRLNNAVLIFDKNHPLVFEFLEEFASTFDGNKWGHNGPYLVSRVVAKTGGVDFTILPPLAFYPVCWTKVAGFFARPSHRRRAKWVEAKIRQLNESSYGVHLWNKESRELDIEEGSIIGRLISNHCVICNY